MTQGGKRKVGRPRKRIGRGPLSDILGSLGLGRKRRTRRGKGFFGDLWNGIKSGVSTIAPVVLPTLAKLALSRLGGRRRRTRGRSLLNRNLGTTASNVSGFGRMGYRRVIKM